MTFTIDLSDDFFFPPDSIDGGAFSAEQISEAVRFATRETMRRMNTKLRRMTTHWKQSNVPHFESNFDIDQQLGLKQLDRQPIEFTLANTRLWNLLDAGAPPHRIKERFAQALRFTGWHEDPSAKLRRGYQTLQQRYRHQYKLDRIVTRDVVQGGVYRRVRTPALSTVTIGRHKRASRTQYPPTYLSMTVPQRFVSRRPKYLGNAKIHVAYKHSAEGGLRHPGFEGRGLTETLVYGRFEGGGGDLADFYERTLRNKLEQSAGFVPKPPRFAYERIASLRKDQREYFLAGDGKISYAVQRYRRNRGAS